MGPRWLEFFRAARGASVESIDSAIRFTAGASADRQEAARGLGEFKLRLFLQIAIADLLGRFDVVATMRAVSRLPEGCFAGGPGGARALLGRRAPPVGGVCARRGGQLGAPVCNL